MWLEVTITVKILVYRGQNRRKIASISLYKKSEKKFITNKICKASLLAHITDIQRYTCALALSFPSYQSIQERIWCIVFLFWYKEMRWSYNHGGMLVTVSLAFKAHVAYRRISTLYSLCLNYNSPCFSSATQVFLFSLEAGKRNETVLCFVITHKSKGGWNHKFNFIGRRWSLFLFKIFLYSFMPRCFMHLHDMN